jgi:predicted AlkP superfamily pyrophosphatase or phosphodiesterase
LLGSPKLSSLVREDYRTSRELPDSKIAAEIKHLILDRLPLFLYEISSRTKFSSDWPNNENNFIVKAFEKISVIRSLHHGDIHESSSYDISVTAKLEGSGPIELLLAENKQLEMHE